MRTKLPAFYKHYSNKRLLRLIPSFASLLIALLSGVFLFSRAIIDQLTSTIITIGLDPLRAQLIAALIMVLGAALVGAALGRRKLGALVGAGLVFCFRYLIAFIQLELRPVYDPGGHLEPLNNGALVHTSFVMMALALVSAFFGAAGGAALSEVLLDPLYQSGSAAWNMIKRTSTSPELHAIKHDPPSSRGMLGNWFGAGVMIVLLVLASSAGPLFIFTPDVGLHMAPTLRGKQGEPDHGTIVQDSVVSPALGGERKPFLVYLPPSYNTPAGRTRRYPTLYLLHGSPGSDHDWVTAGKADESADTLIATGKIPELIMIFPDGNGRAGQTSEWGNSFDQRQLMETFVAVDLVTYVDQHYRTLSDAAHRGIGGLSMGGFGAMNIAIHHPDIFGTVIALGGYYRAEGSIWGNDAATLQKNSPINVLPHDHRAWKLHIFIGAATHDQPYYTDTKQFIQELDLLHIPYYFDLQDGYHSWRVWQVQLYDALVWLKWG